MASLIQTDTAPLVLLLASFQDPDAMAVAEHLSADRVVWLDSERPLRGEGSTWCLDPSTGPGLLLGDRRIRPNGIRSVFHRLDIRRGPGGLLAPYSLVPSPDVDAEYHEFVRREYEALVLGALTRPETRWVNDPAAASSAEFKLHQLAAAARLGLRVPATVVSDDTEALTRFWHEQNGRVVTKAVDSGASRALREMVITREVAEEDLAVLAASVPCPTVFQERIPAAYDVRVTLAGDETFVCVIHSQDGDSPLDWRLDQSVAMREGALPSETLTALQALRRTLGLEIGAVDLRVTPEGAPVFLEINAWGTFAFVEHRTGMPISKAVAALLSRS